MTLLDMGVFTLFFLIIYLIGALVIGTIHRLTHNHTKSYRIGLIIFALLAAATITYTNLGRWESTYANPTELFQNGSTNE